MSLDLKEIVSLIDHATRAGSETHNIEFKDARGGFGKGVWKTISSFTNSPEGGYIVYGIEEKNDGVVKVVGGLDVANIQDRIRSFCIEGKWGQEPLCFIRKKGS